MSVLPVRTSEACPMQSGMSGRTTVTEYVGSSGSGPRPKVRRGGFDRHCRGLATKRTGRPRIQRDHWPIASRRLVRPRRRRATFVVSAASLSRIRSARRSRRDSSLSTSRRRSAPSKALRARTKHRCASTARSRSNLRAIAEKEVPVSRRARACASSCGAESRCPRGDPPRSGLDVDRLLERGPCVCLGTAEPPTQPQGVAHVLQDVGAPFESGQLG